MIPVKQLKLVLIIPSECPITLLVSLQDRPKLGDEYRKVVRGRKCLVRSHKYVIHVWYFWCIIHVFNIYMVQAHWSMDT